MPAPKKSLRPKARKSIYGEPEGSTQHPSGLNMDERMKPMRPKARPDSVMERGAVKRGNNEAKRRSKETKLFSYGGDVKYKDGGKVFPDLNNDGDVTRADILKGRGVEGFYQGGDVRSNSKRGKCY